MIQADKLVSQEEQQDTSTIFSQEQLYWQAKAIKFAKAIPLTEILKSDLENTFNRSLFEKACQAGFGALPFATTFGGSGGDYLSFCLVNEEFARACVPIMSSLGVHVLCQEPVYRFGTDEQKKNYLTASAIGKYLAAFGLTEPGAGSDTAALATTAKLVGNQYVLNGTKVFITSGAAADYFIVMAKLQDLEKELGASKSITAFIVDRNSPGFAIGQKFDMLGMRGYATCEIVMNDCRIPATNILAKPGEGRKVALSSLAKGRVTIAAQATGWAQGALDAIANHMHALSQQGKSIEGIAPLAGQLAAEVEAARVLTYNAAKTIDSGEPDPIQASYAKVFATDCAMHVATEAISIIGIDGVEPNLLLERIFRDAKAGQIYEGTNQIQRTLIARSLLK